MPDPGYALVGHAHGIRELPRSVRYLVILVGALVLVVAVLAVLVGRLESRQDATDLINERRVEQRTEELEQMREENRLTLCNLLAELPPTSETVQRMRGQLECNDA